MKPKAIVTLCLMVVLVLFLLGDTQVLASQPSITVISPGGGEVWTIGGTYEIRWESEGLPEGGYVNVILLKDDAVYSVLAEGTENDGSYFWTIPCDMPAQWGYKIKVKSYDPVVAGVSGNFKLGGNIQVVSPGAGAVWRQGETYDITWTSDVPSHCSVKIRLKKNGAWYRLIVGQTPNDGSYSWTIPYDVEAGTGYQVKILIPDSAGVLDDSDEFEIVPN